MSTLKNRVQLYYCASLQNQHEHDSLIFHQEEQMTEYYAIGDRVRDLVDGERATVYYVGPVPPSSGEWLGVDWDSGDIRGRHDGCNPKDGKRYFTSTNPKSGSFVRPRKVNF